MSALRRNPTEFASDPTVSLPGGRTLGWAVYGEAGGLPVVALHGSPDSRRIWALMHDAALRRGLRLICPDRPGFGLSDPSPGRSVLDWTDDLTHLADHLGLHRFPVVAISGGGAYAYACACAWAMRERVSGLGLFSVIGPLDRRGATAGMNSRVRLAYGMARRAPWLLRLLVRSLVRQASNDPGKAIRRVERTRPPEDREVIARPEVRRALMANLESQFMDVDTIVHELRLAVQPWPFPLAATFNFFDDLDPMFAILRSWCG